MIFVTGSTGYMGRALIGECLAKARAVRALCRPGSESRLPRGCEVVYGDALDPTTYRHCVVGADTFVHLVGVAHPSPSKAAEFRAVDLVSIQAAVTAARFGGIKHFVYVSVAHPAPLMKAYIEVRSAGEEMIHAAGLNATILRPWYVLGPGHQWAHALRPVYWLMERLPSTRDAAQRLGLITLKQMTAALLAAVLTPVEGVKVVEVPEIRRAGADRPSA